MTFHIWYVCVYNVYYIYILVHYIYIRIIHAYIYRYMHSYTNVLLLYVYSYKYLYIFKSFSSVLLLFYHSLYFHQYTTPTDMDHYTYWSMLLYSVLLLLHSCFTRALYIIELSFCFIYTPALLLFCNCCNPVSRKYMHIYTLVLWSGNYSTITGATACVDCGAGERLMELAPHVLAR
jgi:hypothetical protein